MSKILLVDTNFSAWPIYRYLETQCEQLFVIGGNPADCLAKVNQHYVNADYSNVDALNKVIDSLGVDYLVPGCNDLSYTVCARANASGRFPGLDDIDAVDVIFNKRRFREFSRQHALPVPRVYMPEEAIGAEAVVVKPVDAYSGRGITTLRQPGRQDLDAAIQNAAAFSRSGHYVIEEYVEGQLFSHSAFLRKGVIQADVFVEEHSFANPYAVDTSWVTPDPPAQIRVEVRRCIEKLSGLLSLADGLMHTQFIVRGSAFYLIEITRRCPGDLYSMLIQMSTGMPYAENYARPFLGKPQEVSSGFAEQRHILRHTISSPLELRFSGLRFHEPLSIERYVSLATTGDVVKASPFGRVGLLFASCDSSESRNSLVEKIRNRRFYAIESTW